MTDVDKVVQVLDDVELDAGAKGVFCVVAFRLNGVGTFSDIKALCRDHPPNLNYFLKRLTSKKYLTVEGGEYRV